MDIHFSLSLQEISTGFLTLLILFAFNSLSEAQQTTYAEKLGYPKGAKVLILHVDDVGMSHDSNQGAIKAMEEGVANSLSIMMPCSWVPGFAKYYNKHPNLDAGLHLTLTSEWNNYRWGPVAGAACAPSLVDDQGALYATVKEVVENAKIEEVEKEIRAQIKLAQQMGFNPTHLDSHMGTLFATPELTQLYIELGIEYQIPIMFPAGHNTLISKNMDISDEQARQMQQTGQKLWASGLPVLDDLHSLSYSWKIPEKLTNNDKKLQDYWTKQYINSFQNLEPGITMVIMHCTDPSENFDRISDSGPLRKADMLAMIDPKMADYIEENDIILTTWKELKKRRDNMETINQED